MVISQKVVSKSEGRLVALGDVEPSERARELADSLGKDPRAVQVVLDESAEVLRAERGVLITRTRHGLVCANAGVDQSNVPGDDVVCLLPVDPDGSARRIRAQLPGARRGRDRRQLRAGLAARPGGRRDRLRRASRRSTTAAGRGRRRPRADRDGGRDRRPGSLGRGAGARQGGRDAVVLVRGLERYVTADDGPGAAAIVRPRDEDLFP